MCIPMCMNFDLEIEGFKSYSIDYIFLVYLNVLVFPILGLFAFLAASVNRCAGQMQYL